MQKSFLNLFFSLCLHRIKNVSFLNFHFNSHLEAPSAICSFSSPSPSCSCSFLCSPQHFDSSKLLFALCHSKKWNLLCLEVEKYEQVHLVEEIAMLFLCSLNLMFKTLSHSSSSSFHFYISSCLSLCVHAYFMGQANNLEFDATHKTSNLDDCGMNEKFLANNNTTT